MGQQEYAIYQLRRSKSAYKSAVSGRVDIVSESEDGCGRRLVFCGIPAATRGVFTVTGLDQVFELADDKFAALATLEMIG